MGGRALRLLTGTLTTHDVLRYDYCFREAIASLVPVCDEVVVLDAGSTDGTLQALRQIAAAEPRVRVVEGQDWECAPDYRRLDVLANRARQHVTTPWRLMLDADEVVHEASYPAIRAAVEADGWGHEAFKVRRLNLYGDLRHHVRYDCPHKPCDDSPTRLGKVHLEAFQGAESLQNPTGGTLINRAWIFHYGFVRDPAVMVDKVIDMQRWFDGPSGTPDARVVAMKDEGVPFDWRRVMTDADLAVVDMPHPSAARPWMERRA